MIRAAAATALALSPMLSALGLPAPGSESPPAADASTHGLDYVALGDSFSSGLGLADPVDNSPSFCHRSTHNLPHLVAQTLGSTLTDATCSGAPTANIIFKNMATATLRLRAELSLLAPTSSP